jgi:hypothetical protein
MPLDWMDECESKFLFKKKNIDMESAKFMGVRDDWTGRLSLASYVSKLMAFIWPYNLQKLCLSIKHLSSLENLLS